MVKDKNDINSIKKHIETKIEEDHIVLDVKNTLSDRSVYYGSPWLKTIVAND